MELQILRNLLEKEAKEELRLHKISQKINLKTKIKIKFKLYSRKKKSKTQFFKISFFNNNKRILELN
jgi:hypothetical protein